MNSTDKGVFDSLLEGNRRFWQSNTDFKDLTDSQDPKFVVITCSDSRVSPSIIMDSPLGSIFEIRSAGNVVDDTAIASVEFALEYLNVKGVMVIGHWKCGAVTEARKLFESGGNGEDAAEESFLSKMVHSIYGIISSDRTNRDDLKKAIMENAKAQLGNLQKSPIVKRCLRSQSVAFSSAYYDIESGELHLI